MNLRARIGIGVTAILTVIVAIILFFTLASPRQRTVVVATPAKLAGDEKQLRKELDERLAIIRGKGEPVVVADFKPKPPVDPKADAAIPLLAASKWLDRKDIDEDKVWNLDLSPRMSEADWQTVNTALERFAPALALIDQADGLPAADWKVEYKSPGIGILLRHLNGARQLANMLNMSALSAHRAGRDDLAVRRVTQIVAISRHVDSSTPFLVGHLVGLGISGLAVATIQDIAPTLTIAPTSAAANSAAPSATTTSAAAASRQQIAALIALLLDTKSLPTGLHRAALSERVGTLDTLECVLDGRLTMQELEKLMSGRQTAAKPPLVPPRADLLADAIVLFDYSTQVADAARAERLPEFRKLLPPLPIGRTTIAQNLAASYDRAALSHYQGLLRLHLAAAALAVRQWSLDHHGSMPPSLDALVPKYLLTVPPDPMQPSPTNILFRVAPEPIVYSASVDERKRRSTTAKANPAAPPDFVISLAPRR